MAAAPACCARTWGCLRRGHPQLYGGPGKHGAGDAGAAPLPLHRGSLAGQSFGNLFLAALNGISPSFDAAVRRMSQVLAITGQVLPVTTADVQLEAEFENGATVVGSPRSFTAKSRRTAASARCV